VTVDKSRQYL